ncbi:MAG TPA: radical SAM protein, partial [Myxococcota bacterium]|nr:radical SAM protein [Myxococcota bacterium]
MSQRFLLETIARRLEQEEGTLFGQGRRGVALVYPSPYSVAMSSLGYQTIYRLLNGMPDTHAERAFLPEEEMSGPLLTYESRRPVGDFPLIAFSVSYELEIAGVFQCLTSAGVPLLREQRTRHDPWVVMGGPLTFSNPSPLAPFADVIPMGEAEELLAPLLERLLGGLPRDEALRAVAELPGYYVPAVHGEAMPAVAQCDNALLPACSAIITPNTALSNMFLVEVERGCSRGCTFCVMRRSTNGGMRVVPVDRVLATIPAHARKVGFVGAAVSDHPRIVNILRAMVESGREVGLSSLRADRLTPEFVELLVRGGYRTLTVASDGASERLRSDMEKRIREKHL